jgi:hypothetical protein
MGYTSRQQSSALKSRTKFPLLGSEKDIELSSGYQYSNPTGEGLGTCFGTCLLSWRDAADGRI